MQNISRRVFIKGMAVAAVATAASTVLAGCNFVPGTEEKPVEAPVGQTITLKQQADKDQTVSITVLGCTVNSLTNRATLSLKAVNDTKGKLTFANKEAAAATDLGITVKVFSTKTPAGAAQTLDTALTWKADKNLLDGSATQSIDGNNTTSAGIYSKEGNVYFTPAAGDEDWTKAEVTVSIYDGSAVSSYTFTVNR